MTNGHGMSERLLRFSLDMFRHPVLVCDRDGCISEVNESGSGIVTGFLGKHVARLSPALGDALNAFRITGELLGVRTVRIAGTSYSVNIYLSEDSDAVIMLQHAAGNSPAEMEHLYLKVAFDNAIDGVWVADAQTRVCAINKASEHLNGVRAQQVIGRTIQDMLTDGLMDRSVTMEVLKRKRQVSFVQQIIPLGKSLHVTGTPHYDEEGNIEFVVVIERDMTDLRNMRTSMEETRMARDKARELLTELSLKNERNSDFVAVSHKMRRVADMGLKVGRLGSQSILITGESGAGRHSLAQYIHHQGVYSNGPFMTVSCQAIPPSLQDAELFGHISGAVPGLPGKGKAGVLALAEGGTLMLDDIDELSLQTQAKLLRCLDDGYFMPLGTRSRKKMSCCLIVTSRDSLDTLVERGLFREDLYHRLTMYSLHIPPLRDRSDDIPALATLFLKQANTLLNTRVKMTPLAESLLVQQEYPGNTHDLEALIMKAVAICEDGDLAAALQAVAGTLLDAPDSDRSLRTLQERVDEVERDALTYAREVCYNTRDMGRLLGISQTGVVRKLKKHGLGLPRK